ncbi:MAG: hypothetical protein HDR74_06610 [Bacteroides sp.]|nr:hypothetical protein [Bacteroides sp.]
MIVAASAVEQVNVSGTVIDKESNEQLTGASVIVKGADGKIKKFTTSKGDGGFAMSLPMVEGCHLEVNIKSGVSVTIHRFFIPPHSSGYDGGRTSRACPTHAGGM